MLLLTKIAVGTAYEMTGNEALLYTLLSLTLLLLIVVLILAVATMRVLAEGTAAQERLAAQVAGIYIPAKPKESFWTALDRKYLTNAVAIENEKDIELDHDYDGIRELDNHLPPWWTGLFYASIAFAVVYLLVFHVWKQAPLQVEELAIENKAAEISIAAYQAKAADAIDESNVTLTKDHEELEVGKTLFDKNCKVCHGAEGQGGVGPNLTDEYWIHGGSLASVFKTIKQGVPQKGMISWKASLKPAEMRAVSSYILVKFQGTHPAGAKEPQGEKYQPETKETIDTTNSKQQVSMATRLP
jgi:cytochrome c oxidase cbb3-type subunit 3